MADIVEPAVEPTAIDGLLVLTMKQVTDERGTVRELYRESAHASLAGTALGPWRQVNATATERGGLRGLHAEDMTKLVAVVAGEALGAYVDLRPGSPSRGAVVTVALVPGVQVLVPRGVANGFQATADGVTEYLYCFDREWQPGMAGQACNPLDPALGIEWPIPVDPSDRSQISQKDLDAPLYADLQETA
jgi:dTDP-4-dehydrorhamnose 3,5-epimerase